MHYSIIKATLCNCKLFVYLYTYFILGLYLPVCVNPMPQKRSQKRGENVQDMACQVLLLSNLNYIKVTKNFYSQSLGNLEVIGVQKTACFAHMTSRSYNPEFNNPLEKVVDTFQRYNTVAVSMHKIGHFTPNILAHSRIPAAYSTLLFTGCVCVASFRGKCQCYN